MRKWLYGFVEVAAIVAAFVLLGLGYALLAQAVTR